MNNKIILGLIAFTLITGGIIAQVTLAGYDLKIRVDGDKTTFYAKDVWWVVAGREYNLLFDGTTKMNRRLAGVFVTHTFNLTDNTTTIIRNTDYIRGPVIKDIYVFDGNIDEIDLFPLSHKVIIYNASPYYYRYEVRDLSYEGEQMLLNETEFSFGHNMIVEWQPNYRWARVYKSGLLKVQYDIPSDYEEFEVRLFDPIIKGVRMKNRVKCKQINYTKTLYNKTEVFLRRTCSGKINVSDGMAHCWDNTFNNSIEVPSFSIINALPILDSDTEIVTSYFTQIPYKVTLQREVCIEIPFVEFQAAHKITCEYDDWFACSQKPWGLQCDSKHYGNGDTECTGAEQCINISIKDTSIEVQDPKSSILKKRMKVECVTQ